MEPESSLKNELFFFFSQSVYKDAWDAQRTVWFPFPLKQAGVALGPSVDSERVGDALKEAPTVE